MYVGPLWRNTVYHPCATGPHATQLFLSKPDDLFSESAVEIQALPQPCQDQRARISILVLSTCLPLGDVAIQILLLDEPHVLRLQRLLRRHEGKVEFPHQFGDQDGDLQQTDVLSDAGARAGAELKVGASDIDTLLRGFWTYCHDVSVHLRCPLRRLEPALGLERVGVWTEDSLVGVCHPAVHADFSLQVVTKSVHVHGYVSLVQHS